MPRTLKLTRALVNKVPESVEDPGAVAEIAALQTDERRAAETHKVLATRPPGDGLWLFAFGSLIWKPAFSHVERRVATVQGWHRKFCLGPDTRYRGNPENPGYMLSLDRGGRCKGVAYRLSDENLYDQVYELIEREPPIPPRWLSATTEHGPIRALTFVNERDFIGYVGGMTLQETAAAIAPAVGMFGSMADYVLNTVTHLEECGIHDHMLWKMQELLADELAKMP